MLIAVVVVLTVLQLAEMTGLYILHKKGIILLFNQKDGENTNRTILTISRGNRRADNNL